MTSKLIVAMAAGTGGIAPSLVHLAQGFIKANPDVPGALYFVGTAIFFVLGGLVAFFFAETEARKAFFLGIGLPALITTAQTGGAAKPTSASIGLVPSAYAQIATPDFPANRSTERKLNFVPATDCKDCEIWFSDGEGNLISKQVMTPSKGANPVVVPKEATKFGIYDPKSNFKQIPVPTESNTPVTIEYQRKYSPLSDLRRGLGNYDLKSYDADVTIRKK